MTIRTSVAPVVVTGEPLPVDVDIATDHLGEQTFSSMIPAYDFASLDQLEDFIQDSPASPADFARIGQQQDVISQVGQGLFDSTLGRWSQWPTLTAQARSAGAQVRVLIRTSSSVVAAQPWELLRYSEAGAFLALESGVTIVRNPQRLGPTPQMTATRPLRILLCGSTPSDLPQINVAGELQMLASVLAGLGGSVEAFYLNEHPGVCTFAQLRDAITAQGPWHIVHFSGHGGFDASVGGLLAFTTPDGRVDSIPASQIGTLLASHPTLRLVVINACRGAMGAGRQVTDSVAGALVHRGVPACVSMQFEITDRAALPFAQAFHYGIVAHGDVDVALAEARRAINDVSLFPGHAIGGALRCTEWATPVRHLEAADSRLFPTTPPAPAVASGAAVIPGVLHQQPLAPPRHQGSLEEVSRMHWRLTYSTDLHPNQALERAEAAVTSTMDVRKLTKGASGLVAAVGGVFPGAWAATEAVTVEVRPEGRGSSVSIDSRPKQKVLIDNGRNRAALQRVADHLHVDV